MYSQAEHHTPFHSPPLPPLLPVFSEILYVYTKSGHNLFSICHTRTNDTVLCTCIVIFALAFVTFQYMYTCVTITWIHGYHYMDTRVNLRSSLLTNTIFFFLSSLIGNSVTRNNTVAPLVDDTLPQWDHRPE